jgi:flagellar biosynthetic protein FlhB
MADSTQERRLDPTRRRLQEARRRGQIARSRELSGAVGLLTAVAVLAASGPAILGQLTSAIARALGGLDGMARTDPTAEALGGMLVANGHVLLLASGPIALAAMAGSIATAVAQGGLTFSTETLRFQFDRLSPAAGFKRLAPSRAGLDSLRALVSVVLLTAVAWNVVRELAQDAPRLVGASTPSSTARAWELLLKLLWQAAFVLLAIGAVDYLLQRYRVRSALKMTRQEVQEDLRSEEGRPEIKARVRRVQREMFRRRMLKATEKATVVITNPTHYAVALEYNRDKAAAPIVLAKGRDLMAQKIREIARTHQVPIVENPPLARALYAGAEVGDIIPAPLFGAVAEVLAYLVRIRQLML